MPVKKSGLGKGLDSLIPNKNVKSKRSRNKNKKSRKKSKGKFHTLKDNVNHFLNI